MRFGGNDIPQARVECIQRHLRRSGAMLFRAPFAAAIRLETVEDERACLGTERKAVY